MKIDGCVSRMFRGKSKQNGNVGWNVVVHVPALGWGKYSFQTCKEPQKTLIAHSHPTLVSLPELSPPTSSV